MQTIKPEDFYVYIGKITLIHAGIEQDLKGILLEEWDIPQEEINKNYGHRLRKFFLKHAKQNSLNEEVYEQYAVLMDRFGVASEKRNELIKADYSLTRDTGDVYKHDIKTRGRYDSDMDFIEWFKKGARLISHEEVTGLISELGQIRKANFELSRQNFLGKKELIKHD